jgi:hypothetical protein
MNKDTKTLLEVLSALNKELQVFDFTSTTKDYTNWPSVAVTSVVTDMSGDVRSKRSRRRDRHRK